ncbi:MAG TPA: bacterial proteasome activator family protein [Kineosporiaceae bacterium]|nr:bacterial proteasome activator family protein [Kineosporiaceae bacterium]
MTTEPEPGFAAQGSSSMSGANRPPGGNDQERVVVVTADGMAVTGPSNIETNPANQIEQPAKVMRIGSMIKQLLEEVRSAPLDEAGRARLAGIHERSLKELEAGLAPELVEELRAITLPFDDATTPSNSELRIAQAQLVGWLEGLFHGIQTVLFAQQMAARTQLEQMRRALPGGPPVPGQPDGRPGGPGSGTGQYL